MSRYLFVTGDGGGNLTPIFAVIKELVAQGHAIDFMGVPWAEHQVQDTALADSLRQQAIEADARPVGFDAWITAQPKEYPLPAPEKMAAFDNVVTSSFFVSMAPWVADAVHRQLDCDSYDAAAIDMGAPSAAAACESRGVPYAVLVHTIDFLRWWPGRPCPGTGRRAGLEADEERRLGHSMEELLDATWLGCINDARQRLGLGGVEHLTAVEDRAATVIVMTSPEFDTGSAGAPGNHHYVGPCLPLGKPDPAAARLVESTGDERPLVIMSPTTTAFAKGQIGFVRASIEALSALPVRGLVTVGRSLDPARFASAENVTIVGHVNHNTVIPHASALITHCGHGTVMTALRFGVPLVGVPDFSDQRDIGVRVADHGLGVVLQKPASATDIKDGVETVLGDGSFRSAAELFGESLSLHSGPREAAAELGKISRAERAGLPSRNGGGHQ